MRFMIRQIEERAKLPDEITLDALGAAVPRAVVKAVVAELGVAEHRRRKLPAEVGLLLSVAMNLFTQDSLDQVLVKLLKGLRFIWPDPTFVPASKGAVCQARYRLGAQPTVALFHRVCQPMATTATPGAFLFGLRLMAIDGSTEDVPDTLANVSVFGRHTGPRGASAFPQVQGVYLLECGTHAIVDAGFWPCHTSERLGGLRLLRSVTAGMLLMWDRGFHSFDMVRRTRARGAHFLGRVPSHVHFKPLRRLPDGSELAYIYPAEYQRRKWGERLLVRVMAYTFTDPALPGYGERHRLITSLLEAEHAPALALICAYHERWEIEVAIDELDTHQRLVRHPLRSQKPVGVIQELYGLLIAHYAVRRVMHEAAMRAGIDPDRLSFINAVRLVCDAIPEFQMVAPEQQPQLYERLLRDIARYQLPERDHRNHPRVVKRKMSNFHLKRAEHRQWPQPSKTFRAAVSLVN
jgi:Insertion element 4 transposase N-terminal/Transposase DDE domain